MTAPANTAELIERLKAAIGNPVVEGEYTLSHDEIVCVLEGLSPLNGVAI